MVQDYRISPYQYANCLISKNESTNFQYPVKQKRATLASDPPRDNRTHYTVANWLHGGEALSGFPFYYSTKSTGNAYPL
jgi:hypothetical protein